MNIIIFGILIFLEIIQRIIIIDIILSWLSVFGSKIRPKFIADIIDPMYDFIKKIIPTSIGMFDFIPIVIFIIIFFFRALIFSFFPEISNSYLSLSNNL